MKTIIESALKKLSEKTLFHVKLANQAAAQNCMEVAHSQHRKAVEIGNKRALILQWANWRTAEPDCYFCKECSRPVSSSEDYCYECENRG